MEEINPTYFQVLLLFFPWKFLISPSSLSVCAFEIAGVWVISGSSVVLKFVYSFRNIFLKEKASSLNLFTVHVPSPK